MRILIVGDLHGKTPKVKVKGFDVILAPGDFCSDAAKPFLFQSLRERLEGKRKPREWYEIAGKHMAKRLLLGSVADGRKVLQRIASHGKPVYIVPGNWDWTGLEHKSKPRRAWDVTSQNHYLLLFDGLHNVHDTYHRIVDAGECIVIGNGIHAGPEYPQTAADKARFTKTQLHARKAAYDREYKALAKLFMQARKIGKPVIFLSHNVPYDTPLDKIDNPHSPRNGQHFGSVLARKLILEFQPLVCVGGHMHEHFGSCKLGKTTVINAGFGPEKNVLLELSGKRIKTLKFYK
jgi:Icc-related predicted phosphoesterase